MKLDKIPMAIALMLIMSCAPKMEKEDKKIKLITLDPGHFHAALIQKSMYGNVDSTVFVYAPKGPELEQHLQKIEGYNHNDEHPTAWKEEVYSGTDFLEKMLSEKKGNVVVIAGNNLRKTEYIKKSVDANFNVLADKPMVINEDGFGILEQTFKTAKNKGVLLYDIMTERYEITNVLQAELAQDAGILGELPSGSFEKPSIEMESVHYFSKVVSGKPLIRPYWFMDVAQQGEGIADVAVHLVDLAQWGYFPNQVLDYKKDIELLQAKRWPTSMTLPQFSKITSLASFPESLKPYLKNNMLEVFANGEINYKLKGIYVKIRALWEYEAKKGGDTHEAIIRGSKSSIVIRQGSEQNFEPTLYVEPIRGKDKAMVKTVLDKKIVEIQQKYPEIQLRETKSGWEIYIPKIYREGHEAHFAQVAKKYFSYIEQKEMPNWEVSNMIAKYYITTQALKMAKQNK
jgi:predicted dehydrogenase